MATRVNRPVKVVAFNPNGISKQNSELSKQRQDLHIDFIMGESILLRM
jgi:hypothetical protein